MRIKHLAIEGIGGIKNLEISFHDRMNILCGPNGIGKTTILDSIANIFGANSSSTLRRNADFNKGVLKYTIENRQKLSSNTLNFSVFSPFEPINISGRIEFSINLISIKINRNFQYNQLSAISKDEVKTEYNVWTEALVGIQFEGIKSWFVNRFMFSKHNSLSEQQIGNFELAKKCFSVLNEKFAFHTVDASSLDIMLATPNGVIYYEYLSAGFKSIISILFGIIREIEIRFNGNRIFAKDFDGVILIDEIELHLHPEWQERIIDVLLDIFPKAQFVVSTHSPHVIQTASPNQIIALWSDGEHTKQRELPNREYGFQGWTIEEVLIDVMGMTNLRTEIFENLVQLFGKAIAEEDFESASEYYKKLDSLLHPNNELRKLFKFQLLAICE